MATPGETPDALCNLPILPLFDFVHDDSLRDKIRRKKELHFVFVGLYHAGKSTLIGSMLKCAGVKVSREKTNEVITYTAKIEDTDSVLYIYDTPGLGDHDTCETCDAFHLRKVMAKSPKIDIVIFCRKMNDTLRPDEKAALICIALNFGENVLENAVIALTFANSIEPVEDEEVNEADYFNDMVKTRKKEFEELVVLDGDTDGDSFKGFMNRTYPVGLRRKAHLPNREKWLDEFWVGCIDACNNEAHKVSVQTVEQVDAQEDNQAADQEATLADKIFLEGFKVAPRLVETIGRHCKCQRELINKEMQKSLAKMSEEERQKILAKLKWTKFEQEKEEQDREEPDGEVENQEVRKNNYGMPMLEEAAPKSKVQD